MSTTPLSTAFRQVRPSPIFLGFVGAAAAMAVLLWTAGVKLGGNSRVLTFLFVVSGWVLTLCLHEFGHAFAAYVGGDRSVVGRGYLTLDPRKYANPLLSIGLPVLFLALGGIGLPGGAVWVNRGAIRSPIQRSVMSLAGPLANLVAGIVLLGLSRSIPDDRLVLVSALSFLGQLQIMACLFNLIPIPGFDGFGAIEPFLPRELAATLWPAAQFSMVLVFLVFFRNGPIRDGFFNLVDSISNGLGGPTTGDRASIGYFQFQFWKTF